MAHYSAQGALRSSTQTQVRRLLCKWRQPGLAASSDATVTAECHLLPQPPHCLSQHPPLAIMMTFILLFIIYLISKTYSKVHTTDVSLFYPSNHLRKVERQGWLRDPEEVTTMFEQSAASLRVVVEGELLYRMSDIFCRFVLLILGGARGG